MEARTRWTDERLDDFAEAMRPVPREVSALRAAVDHLTEETKGLRGDFSGLRSEFSGLRSEFSGLRGDFSALQRQLTQVAFALVGTLAAAIVALSIKLLA